ncbi:MAG: hypothetical protein EXR66_09845 [Dehalococcoidia bacterium]|nr:hypothetical protein [Dehalococcoidia bacterium]
MESDLLTARAALLGAWAIAGGKSGSEAGLVRFCGGAGVVDPSGQWSVRAPADQPGTVSTAIGVDSAPGPAIDFATLPAMDAAAASRKPLRATVAAVAFDPHPSAVESMERLRALVNVAVAAGAHFVVLPDLAGTDPLAVTATETLPFLQALTQDSGVTLFASLAERADGATYKTTYAIEGGQILATHRQSVLDRDEQTAGFSAGASPSISIRTAFGAVGLMSGAERPGPGGARRRGRRRVVRRRRGRPRVRDGACPRDRGRPRDRGGRLHVALRRGVRHRCDGARTRQHASRRGGASDGAIGLDEFEASDG